MLDEISFDERGLVPVVVQDEASAEVLMLAYANAKALELTHGDGGDALLQPLAGRDLAQRRNLGGDDGGAAAPLRLRRRRRAGDRRAAGPACHTGERTCFYREVAARRRTRRPPGEPRVVHEALPALERTLKSRAAERPEGSYTVELLDNPTLIGEKVEEEAEEVVRAAREETDERVAEEAADVLYHLAVLLAARGVPPAGRLRGAERRAG